jgi:hypothetical protein
MGAARTSGTAHVLVKTTDNGTTWSLQSGPTVSISNSYGEPSLLVFNANRIGFTMCPSGTGTAVATYSESQDQGVTWSTEETSASQYVSASKTWAGQGYCGGSLFGSTGAGRINTIISTSAVAPACGGFGCSSLSWASEPSVVPSATVSWTGTLQGFDVDDNGDTVIVRSNSGEIRTYAGPTLSLLASDVAAGGLCNTVDKVMSAGTVVGYVICSGGNDPTFLQVRTPGLALPNPTDLNGACSSQPDTSSCANINLAGFSEAGGDCAKQYGRIDAYPITFATSNGANQNRQVAWAWSSLDPVGPCSASAGQIGVNAFKHFGTADTRNSYSQSFAGTQAEQICTGMDGTQFYIGAAGTDANTKTFPFTFSTTGSDSELIGAFGSPATMPALYGQANSIDCGGNLVIVRNNGNLAVLNRATGAVVSSKTVTGTETRAATISPIPINGIRYAAWMDAAKIRVGYASNLTVLCTLTPPTGSHVEMQFVSNGPSLFEVTNTNGARYQLGGACGTIPNVGTNATAPPPAASGTLFGDSVSGLGVAIGSTFGAQLVLAVLTILILAAAGFFMIGQSPWGGGVGAGAGVLLSWGFGFLTTGAIFASIVLGAVVWYFARGTTSQGGM